MRHITSLTHYLRAIEPTTSYPKWREVHDRENYWRAQGEGAIKAEMDRRVDAYTFKLRARKG